MKCRLCKKSGNSQSIRASHVFGGKDVHNFWQCEICNAIYLHPPLSKKDEQYFYKKEFEKYMSTRVGDHRDWTNAEKHVESNQDQVDRRWRFLEPHVYEGMNVLEIGCSSGFMLNKFKENKCNPVGVEPSGEFLEFIKKNNFEAYQDISEVKGNFDLICHFFVFEHIGDPFFFLEQQMSLLNKNGLIIAEIPSATDPLTSIYDIPAFEEFYWSIAHHFYYTPKSLKYVLDKMNLKYEIIPEQRYDLSNHMTWMMEGKPGGQKKYNNLFSKKLEEQYMQDLKDNWSCDTIFLKIFKS
jgi:SAM-dependent methyltransferase